MNKKIFPLLVFVMIIILSWFAETDIYASLGFKILTWIGIISVILPYFSMKHSPELIKQITKTFKDGKHLPKMLDILCYIIIIGILILNSWTGYAVVWTLIAFADLRMREVANLNLTLV